MGLLVYKILDSDSRLHTRLIVPPSTEAMSGNRLRDDALQLASHLRFYYSQFYLFFSRTFPGLEQSRLLSPEGCRMRGQPHPPGILGCFARHWLFGSPILL